LGKVRENFYSLVAWDWGNVPGHLGVEVFGSPRRKHGAKIGIAVSESARRLGVGSALPTSAIDLCRSWLGVLRIELVTYTDNAAAISLFKKHGFVLEGTGVGYALRSGRYVDAHFMACRVNA
jgi:putative acetyltransferase